MQFTSKYPLLALGQYLIPRMITKNILNLSLYLFMSLFYEIIVSNIDSLEVRGKLQILRFFAVNGKFFIISHTEINACHFRLYER